MDSVWPIVLGALIVLNCAFTLALLLRRPLKLDPEPLRPQFDVLGSEIRRVEQSSRDELARNRGEAASSAAGLRQEISNLITTGLETLLNRQTEAQSAIEAKLEMFRQSLESGLHKFGESSDTRLANVRQELNESLSQSRNAMRQTLTDLQNAVATSLQTASRAQSEQLTNFAQKLEKVNDTLGQQLEKIRQTVESKLSELQSRNEQKLEEMRRTVDEKLQTTLERRLTDSFGLVTKHLQDVSTGLGEMKAMAGTVGDLKRVLSNVKARGTWGEIQLGSLLEQILAREQYDKNVAPKPGSPERVEFAIRLPGHASDDSPVWLPIDAKFPMEDYQRLVEAADRADAEAVTAAARDLDKAVRGQARDISEKYIAPPHTTDFAILYLSSEGLYSEVLRRPGLAETLQNKYRVVVSGPTTLAALLNSLQMGFRTLAIQKRSSEVWTLLAAVKTEFGKFGDVLTKVKDKLAEASKQIDETGVRTRAISRTLREVEALPASEASRLIPNSPVEIGRKAPEPPLVPPSQTPLLSV